MALTTYRSQVAITYATLRRLAYEKLASVFAHAIQFNLNVLRVQLMGDNFVEVDFNNPLPSAEQVDHLGLTGPV